MNGFFQRSITAAFIVGIMTVAILAGAITTYALFLVVAVLCLWEFGLLLLGGETRWRLILIVTLGLLPYLWSGFSYFLPDRAGTFELESVVLLVLLFLFSWMILELFFPHPAPFLVLKSAMLSLFYIGFPFSFLLWLGKVGGVYAPGMVFGLVVLTWVFDTGAYLVGSRIGRNKLLPRVSPGKTWEGAIGGLLAAIGISFALHAVFGMLPLQNWLIMAVIVSVFGLLGDLVESMMKRQYARKDSSSLLPGHGGFLDRFDSLIFVIPFVAAYLYWVA